VKNLNFVAGTTRRFVSAKRHIRYFSNSSKLVEHRAQLKSRSRSQDVSSLALYRRRIPSRKAHDLYASYQPRNLNSSHVFDNFLLQIDILPSANSKSSYRSFRSFFRTSWFTLRSLFLTKDQMCQAVHEKFPVIVFPCSPD